ncbi:hypothetical protein AR457_01035 [Streptomyces agglomeratus]|uniref:Secreted protein n=1 Tax=Streptomyces agglomeratus TaxID=285458 RepID=A0A1E5P1D7_9ACTN|nr:hypothetical protein [Streptomyces agglomeratus]OEJ23329.1 hypothetical protein AS594_01235 [Streptomyces agglomeratus]OEJ42902.1 hypothetical protein AR457_01035 [Streptomyces agglomeratus]OEJ55164.1 hypothetical protein BGK72_34670 [Streptomyces agglomeratus]OEJ62537.1 hypothetical protein BGM19_35650 [Streptomyces agglomeratus]
MTVRTVWARRALALAAVMCAGALYTAPSAGAIAAPPPPAECAEDDKQCQEEQKEREQEAKREKGEKEADSGREQVAKDSTAAKQDISKAKGQVESCPPESKDCMSKLVGDGKEQQTSMDEAKQKVQDFKPEPQNNAGVAVGRACDGFAATLPPSAANDPSLTDICELMAQ